VKFIYENQFLGSCCHGLDDLSSFRLFLNKQDSQPFKLWHRSGKNIICLRDQQNCLVGSLPAAAGSTSEGKLTQSVQGQNANGIVDRNYVLTTRRRVAMPVQATELQLCGPSS